MKTLLELLVFIASIAAGYIWGPDLGAVIVPLEWGAHGTPGWVIGGFGVFVTSSLALQIPVRILSGGPGQASTTTLVRRLKGICANFILGVALFGGYFAFSFLLFAASVKALR